MYVRVYAPNGEPFDVPRERADRLILQEGWTQTKPEPAPEPMPAPAKARKRARRTPASTDQ